MITIVLAEDHQIVREGVRALLEKEADFRVVAEAKDGAETVETVFRIKPDVLLLDLTLPRLHGLNVLTQIRDRKNLKVIVLTMHRDDASVLEALRLGAKGYVLKDSPATELADAIRTVSRNELFVSHPLRELVHRTALDFLNGSTRKSSNDLTQRERMVLQLAAGGTKNEMVAAKLGISIRTAEKHRANVMRKLQLHNQGELLRYAIRHNLIET